MSAMSAAWVNAAF